MAVFWAAALMTVAMASAAAAELWFKISTDAWFIGWQRQVQALVNRDGHETSNQVCIVGLKSGGTVMAYVYWPTNHSLTTWFPAPNDPDALIYEPHVLDLGKDVVATDADVDGSTYLVTRAWVRRVVSHCRTAGITIDVTRRPRQAHAG